MALDLWIYGPGFGETVVMRWDGPHEAAAGMGKRLAVVDTHAGNHWKHQPVLRHLKHRDECLPMALVAASHPHLDHVRHLHQLLELAPPEQMIWWVGDATGVDHKYRRMAAHAATIGREQGKAAQMAATLIRTALVQSRLPQNRLKIHSAMLDDMAAFDLGGMTMTTMGPHEVQRDGYWADFLAQFPKGTNMFNASRSLGANRASLGLRCRHGKTEVVLGGDMEQANWTAWWKWAQKDKERRPFPAVIKVSHHGSSNGMIDDMWKGRGFFDSHAGISDPARMPVCVVTPWRKGGRLLPDRTVIRKMREAGCTVVITAHLGETNDCDLTTAPCESHAHIRVDDNGIASVCEDSRLCEVLDPLD